MQEIAKQTDEIASLIVISTNEKEFHGKENVQAKVLGNNEESNSKPSEQSLLLSELKKDKNSK